MFGFGRRLVSLKHLPMGMFRAVVYMCMAAGLLNGFARFWHFCTFEASHYLHGWGVFQTGAETIGRAFPMTEVNGVRFDFNLQHILICAIMICTQYMHYGRTTRDIMEEGITLTKEEKKKRAKAEEKKRRALAAEL